MLDANIDAHLLDYNVNENLSLKPYFENDNLTNSSSIGLKIKIKFIMKVAIIGYGNMGKEIEKVLISRGHEISKVIDIENNNDDFKDTDIAIIFSTPSSAVENIKKCLINDIPVVCGTTGWLDNYEEIKLLCEKSNGTFFVFTQL